jgi:hypothetical protein
MIIRANRLLAVVAMLCPVSVVAADPTHEPSPVVRGAQSVESNLAKQPENQGLLNARDRLRDNQLRFESKHQTRTKNPSSIIVTGAGSEQPDQTVAVDQPARPESVQRPERIEKPERVALPEKPERPEQSERPEKPEKPERPEKPGKPERPEKP